MFTNFAAAILLMSTNDQTVEAQPPLGLVASRPGAFLSCYIYLTSLVTFLLFFEVTLLARALPDMTCLTELVVPYIATDRYWNYNVCRQF